MGYSYAYRLKIHSLNPTTGGSLCNAELRKNRRSSLRYCNEVKCTSNLPEVTCGHCCRSLSLQEQRQQLSNHEPLEFYRQRAVQEAEQKGFTALVHELNALALDPLPLLQNGNLNPETRRKSYTIQGIRDHVRRTPDRNLPASRETRRKLDQRLRLLLEQDYEDIGGYRISSSF